MSEDTGFDFHGCGDPDCEHDCESVKARFDSIDPGRRHDMDEMLRQIDLIVRSVGLGLSVAFDVVAAKAVA